MQGKHGHLSREQKQLALRLHGKGWRLVDIAKEIGCSAPMVGIMARTGRHLDARPFGWEPRQGCLTIDEREQILLGINLDSSWGCWIDSWVPGFVLTWAVFGWGACWAVPGCRSGGRGSTGPGGLACVMGQR